MNHKQDALAAMPRPAPLAAPQPRYLQLAKTLLNEIEGGKYPVGSQLPTELELCEQFGVSRATAREALRRLVQLGLVVRQPRVGTTVKARTAPAAGYRQSTVDVGDLYQYATDTTLVIESSETVQIVGLYVEHEKTFFHLLESEPAHLLAFMCELERSLNPDNAKRYDGLKNVHVALAVDDVATEGATKAFPRWCAVDAPLPSQPLPKTKPLEEQVADAVQAALGLGKVLKGQSASIMAQTLSSARTSHHQHLPKPNLVERLLACGCCLTLAEYVEVYAGVPAVVRPAEIVHPVEPSLNYEVAA